MEEVSFFMHGLGKEHLAEIEKVFQTPILSTGKTVKEFEDGFANYLRAKHCLGLSSCTAALQLSLYSLGVGSGDEVITTPMTFVASAEAIINCGARPVFVDVEADTGNIDANLIETAITDKTKAILPVHLYGHMCDMKKVKDIADKHDLFIVEDCAHTIEGQRDSIRPGQLGDTACFSFFATKNLTCGEGGALVTNNTNLYNKMKPLHLHGMNKTAYDRFKEGYQHWDVEETGFKYNMSNLQAALLLPQLPKIEKNLSKRHTLADLYTESLSALEHLTLPATKGGCRHARHLFPIWVHSEIRDSLISKLGELKVSAVVNYRPLHFLQYFKREFGYEEGSFPNAEKIGMSTISLPFYPDMPRHHVELVTTRLKKCLLTM